MDINGVLESMHENRAVYKKKGDLGEEAVRRLLVDYKGKRGGVIFLSYTYPYQSDFHSKPYPGNLIWQPDQKKFRSVDSVANRVIKDEIDLLYVTSNRIFAIEVKARSGKWDIYDHWCKQSSNIQDKSPIAQTEKHARHLYHLLHEVIPDGNPDYIVPLTVFVDEAVIKDTRSEEMKEYIPVCILNNFIDTLMKYDKPKNYTIDLNKVRKTLKQKGSGKEF